MSRCLAAALRLLSSEPDISPPVSDLCYLLHHEIKLQDLKLSGFLHNSKASRVLAAALLRYPIASADPVVQMQVEAASEQLGQALGHVEPFTSQSDEVRCVRPCKGWSCLASNRLLTHTCTAASASL